MTRPHEMRAPPPRHATAAPSPGPAEDAPELIENPQALLHELRTHQVELETQNEELCRAQQELEEARDLLTDLYDHSPVGYLTVNEEGLVHQVNLTAARMLGLYRPALIDVPFSRLVAPEHQDTLHLFKRKFDHGAELAQCEVELLLAGERRLWCALEGVPVRAAASGARGMRVTLSDISERRRAFEENQRYQQRLKELTSQLEQSQEQERRSIAAGLHDSVGQTLVSCKIQVAQLAKQLPGAEARGALDRLDAMLQNSIDEIRDLTFNLSPPLLYELGLGPALEWLLEQNQQRHGIDFELINHLVGVPLSVLARQLLYASARELLFNVVKHAGASRVVIQLRGDESRVQLVVEDDGRGMPAPAAFPPLDGSQGLGHFRIAERVSKVGGTFELESHAGQVTRATLTLPAHPLNAA